MSPYARWTKREALSSKSSKTACPPPKVGQPGLCRPGDGTRHPRHPLATGPLWSLTTGPQGTTDTRSLSLRQPASTTPLPALRPLTPARKARTAAHHPTSPVAPTTWALIVQKSQPPAGVPFGFHQATAQVAPATSQLLTGISVYARPSSRCYSPIWEIWEKSWRP